MKAEPRNRGRRRLPLLMLVVLAAACGSSGSKASPSSTKAPSKALEGTSWALTEVASPGVSLTGVSASARFGNGSVGGSSGCNTYDAPYRASGSTLTIGPNITGTKMACPPGPTAVESAYLARLPEVTSYEVRGSTLTLAGKNGKALLVYRGGTDAAAITGAWTVTGYYTGTAVQSVLGGATLTANFGPKEIAGNGGCNTFSGPYEITGDTIKIGDLASTLMACADPELQTQEQHYLEALGLATTYRVTGTRLELLRADGGLAVTLETARG